MNSVSLQALQNYHPAAVDVALARLLEPLGGIQAFISPGQKVLLKPNMLAGKSPAKAVTTHPEIVRAVIRLAQQAGGIVSVGDSPGLGNPEQVASKCGILQVLEETGAGFAPFSESVPVQVSVGTFHQLELSRDVLEADVIINLPKLKTHQMMGLTCAVKNLFGAVVGMRKARLHLQAGADKAFFALMLLEIAERVAPALNIVDAVVGMEGNGPGSGDPVAIGALLAGRDPLAVDTLACELVRMPARQVWTQQIARQRGRSGTRLEELQTFGPAVESLCCESFRPAKNTDSSFGLPGFLQRRLKRALNAYPAIDADACIRCGHCVDHCPPQAMQLDQRVEIDDLLCIRCFCCQELCPRGAIHTDQGWLLKLAERLRKTGK